MNCYIVVEGVAEKLVYSKWIPLLNKNLTEVSYPSELVANNFVIVTGNGYPLYTEIIDDALADLQSLPGDTRLVVSVDSEDMTRQEKFNEILGYISAHGAPQFDYRIVIQHFCFETWALGNRKMGPRNPQSILLRQFKDHFDVFNDDPEQLQGFDGYNRAQTALRYLKQMIADKGHHLSYSKGDPRVLQQADYLDQIRRRLNDTHHIDSFSDLITAFS